MARAHIKICGLKTPELAEEAVRLGADYIGIIFHPRSKRYVSIDQAIEIAQSVHSAGGKVVPVFVDQDAGVILEYAKRLDADILQLHGRAAVDAYHELTQYYPCIIAVNFAHDMTQYDSSRDFLLYDYHEAGSGQSFDWDEVEINPSFRSFIAGGINASNVQEAIAHFKPYAVDTSSGVEDKDGNKSIDLIHQFCRTVDKEVLDR
jgi:phosphoribosylanthranilate isomerase